MTSKGEVDFVVKTDKGFEYFQVTATMMNIETSAREIAPLEKIKDNYPKTILTLDPVFADDNTSGIEKINALTWLCGIK